MSDHKKHDLHAQNGRLCLWAQYTLDIAFGLERCETRKRNMEFIQRPSVSYTYLVFLLAKKKKKKKK